MLICRSTNFVRTKICGQLRYQMDYCCVVLKYLRIFGKKDVEQNTVKVICLASACLHCHCEHFSIMKLHLSHSCVKRGLIMKWYQRSELS